MGHPAAPGAQHQFSRDGRGPKPHPRWTQDADLFVSHRDDNRFDSGPKGWQPAENLGCVVNSPFKDAGPTYFEDEATGITTLYFTRQNNPPGSDQGWDIYATARTGDEGAFGPPVLVPELSSPYRDTRTAIRRDGLEIFLSSGRPGDDVGGPPINSASFDGAPALSFDGTELYFFSARPGGIGLNDLYCTTRQRPGRGHPAPSCGESK